MAEERFLGDETHQQFDARVRERAKVLKRGRREVENPKLRPGGIYYRPPFESTIVGQVGKELAARMSRGYHR